MFHIASCKAPPQPPEHVSEEAKAFLRQVLQVEARDRPTCQHLLQMSFCVDKEKVDRENSLAGPSWWLFPSLHLHIRWWSLASERMVSCFFSCPFLCIWYIKHYPEKHMCSRCKEVYRCVGNAIYPNCNFPNAINEVIYHNCQNVSKCVCFTQETRKYKQGEASAGQTTAGDRK